MGEIGSGTGSSYPGTLDTDASLEVSAPAAGKTKASANVPNDLASAILAIETELGIDPAGSKATVVARLNTSLEADGSPKDTVIVTVSGQNQTVTGHKVFPSGISTGIWGLVGTATVAASGKMVVTGSGAIIAHGGSGSETGSYLKTKIIEIGDWNMDVTQSVSVAHGVSLANIRAISVMIRDDANTLYYGEGAGLDYARANSALIDLWRTGSGGFDNTSFDSTSFNRGWIIIDYV